MPRYIDAEALQKELRKLCDETECDVAIMPEVVAMVREAPTADVVSHAAYNQVAWERDLAVWQLENDYGVGIGERKPVNDVVPVVHGRWIERIAGMDAEFVAGCTYYECSVCGRIEEENGEPYCHCGARMDEED